MDTRTLALQTGLEAPCAYIDGHAIAHNLSCLRKQCHQVSHQQPPRIWAVVKADAYGHGLEHVLPYLVDADGVMVLDVLEAQRCRALGWKKPILLLHTPTDARRLQDPILSPLHVVVADTAQLAAIEQCAGSVRHFVWLRHRGDLHHAGWDNEGYLEAYRRMAVQYEQGNVAGLGHLCHYARAEDQQARQDAWHAFMELIANLPGPVSTENSAAMLGGPMPTQRMGWVRSGILLYGVSPDPQYDGADWGLRPAMILQAPIYALQTVPAGRSIGYGLSYTTTQKQRIALVRCGYADGYPRLGQAPLHVLVHGRRCPVRGKASMDTLAIDVSELPDCRPGATVTLWGAGALGVESVARASDTIAAQLLTGLTARVRRRPAPPHVSAVLSRQTPG